MRHFSKSKLMAFRQCPKRLWLEVHRPELREDSKGSQARFKAGHQVGDIARTLYDPDGGGDVIDVNAEGYDGAFAHSAELLKNSTQPIFEAGFKAAGALAFADVMLPEVENEQPAWKMVEVKSTTGVKDYHRDDIAVQAIAAQASVVKLKSVAMAHIDCASIYTGTKTTGAYSPRAISQQKPLPARMRSRAGLPMSRELQISLRNRK